MNEANEVRPWDREAGEPMRWYARFERYRALGPNRSLLATYRQEYETKARNIGKPRVQRFPPEWTTAAHAWRWRERAEAWDAHEIAESRKAQEEERKKVREEHLMMLRAYRAKVAAGIMQINPAEDKLWWKSATEALRMLGAEFRAMYDEEATIKLAGPDGEPLIPLEALARLAERARAREREQETRTDTRTPGGKPGQSGNSSGDSDDPEEWA